MIKAKKGNDDVKFITNFVFIYNNEILDANL